MVAVVKMTPESLLFGGGNNKLYRNFNVNQYSHYGYSSAEPETNQLGSGIQWSFKDLQSLV